MSEMANPLVNYRAPRPGDIPVRHAPIEGKHFAIKRGDVENMQGTSFNFVRGDFRLRADPTLEIEIGTWEDLPRAESAAQLMNMTTTRGWQIAMAEDVEVLDENWKLYWKPDAAGRLTFGGKSENVVVLMWRTGEAHDAQAQRSLRMSIDINKSVEEKLQEQAEKMRQRYGTGGDEIRVEVDMGSDDGDEGSPKYRSRKRR